MKQLQMIGGRVWEIERPAFHVDDQAPDLSPAPDTVWQSSKAKDGPEVEQASGVDRHQREVREGLERRALDRHPQADESVVHCTATIALRRWLARAGDLEMSDKGHGGESTDEGGDVGGGVEERSVLLDQEVGHLPRAILGTRRGVPDGAAAAGLRLVHEDLFFARNRIDQGRQEGLRRMRHNKG